MINSNVIKYVTCCKLWLEFHKSNSSLLLRFKLTDSVYYLLMQQFNLINIRYVSLSNKTLLDNNDIDIINKELVKYNDFFDIMSIINQSMNNN